MGALLGRPTLRRSIAGLRSWRWMATTHHCIRELTADRYDTGVYNVAHKNSKPDTSNPRNQLSVQSFWRRRVLPHHKVGLPSCALFA